MRRPPAPVTRPGASAEVSLAAEVIMHAWNDAIVYAIGPSMHDAYKTTRMGAAKARLFLTAEAGEWRASREAWADIAGIDPVALRERALAALAGNDERLAA